MPYSSTGWYLFVFSTKIYKVQILTLPIKKERKKKKNVRVECCWVISLLASQFINFICDIISMKFPLKSCLNCCKIFVFYHYLFEIIFFCSERQNWENDIYKKQAKFRAKYSSYRIC